LTSSKLDEYAGERAAGAGPHALNQIVSWAGRLPHGAHLHPSDTIVYAAARARTMVVGRR